MRQLLCYVVGYGLLLPGIGATLLALNGVYSYLVGDTCSTGLLGIFLLPFSIPMMIGGIMVIREARRLNMNI